MKKFVSGFLTGALIFGTVGAVAVTYVTAPATFKVLVNGKEFVSNPPAMVVNDRTYLPLRAMGDALDIDVNWNAELGQAEINTIQDTSEKIVYYENFSEIPDFAYTADVSKKQPEYDSNSKLFWAKYMMPNLDGLQKAEQYEKILLTLGYKDISYKYSSDMMQVYQKNNIKIGIIADNIMVRIAIVP